MKILVTGGSGAFGSAFIAKLHSSGAASRIVCYSRGEHAQEKLARTLQTNVRGDGTEIRFFIGDVRDYRRLRTAMKGIDVVVHAAALKIVPTGEYNPTEFVKTNVLGAQNVIDAALNSGVEKVVALSTDKACSPINLYGATKLCAEKQFVAANAYGGGATKFSVVRYGNVTGSTGSVVPLWWEQANNQEPLTVTDPEMTRFWMTLGDACDLVLKAIHNMRGGEVFIPDLKSYRVSDLARAVWSQALGWDSDPPTMVIGKREGEKDHESLISPDEIVQRPHWDKELGLYILGGPWRGDRQLGVGDSYRSDDVGERMTIPELRDALAGLGYIPRSVLH